MYQAAKLSYAPVAWLSLVALIVAALLYEVFAISGWRTTDAFLWIEGTVLLESSLQTDMPPVRFKGEQLVGPTSFAPTLYYAGLLCLAIAAIVGAFPI